MATFNRLSSRILGGALLGVVVAGTTGCVATGDYKSLRANLDEAQRQIAEMQNLIIEYRKRISELEAEIAKKDALLRTQSDALAAAMRDRDALRQELADLKAKYNALLATGGGGVSLPPSLVSALRILAEKYPDLLEFDEKLGMIRFKSDMTFDLGSTEVKPRAREALKVLAGILNDPEIVKNEIRVVGHTDDVPIKKMAGTLSPNNWYLSTNRAHAVLAVMREDGMAESRGQSAGWGEQRPVAPNAAGNKGSEKNRRVEIFILPTTVPDGIVISTPGGAAPAPKAPATPAPKAPADKPPAGEFPR